MPSEVNPIGEFNPASVHSDNLPQLLQALNISLALTSYQAQQLALVRSDSSGIEVHFQPIPRPMGLALSADRLVLGSWAQVLDYRRQDRLIGQLDLNGPVDALFVPRGSLVTGSINVHDVAWGDEGLWVVNSTFSCLATLSPEHSFVPRWKPHFIPSLLPNDSCHLNGMAMRDGRPAFVTTFCDDAGAAAWRAFQGNGTVMSVADNRILAEQVLMPHSPRWIDGWLYYCESGHGRVWRMRADGSERTLVAELPGYTRGLDHVGSLLFIGLSKARYAPDAPGLPLSTRVEQTLCGIWVIDLERLCEVAWLVFTGDMEQLYDVVLLHGMRYPEILSWDNEKMANCYSHPPMTGIDASF